jgi:murein DD-endopeptidase MepM/ murein hydrolase activator NlpD
VDGADGTVRRLRRALRGVRALSRRAAGWLTPIACLVLWASLAAADPPPSIAPRTHTVGRGDTLGSIASRYGVSVAALVAANRLASERVVLRIGQRLALPTAAPPRVATAARTPPGTTPSRPAAPSTSAVARASVVTRAPTPPRPPVFAQGPRGLELAVPDFLDASPLFTWPVEGPVTSTFGRRRSAWHRGIDIKAERGAVVFAAAAGVVVTSGIEPRYGRVVKIEHDRGFVTVYAHNEENLVQAGMHVSPGDPIATIGKTGRATAHHLHFEIRRNGAVYNPLYLLPLPPQVGQVEESDEPDEQHE